MKLSPLLVPEGDDTCVEYNDNYIFGGDTLLVWNDVSTRFGVGLASPRDTIEVVDRLIFDPTLYNTLCGYQSGDSISAGVRDTYGGYQSAKLSDGDDGTALGYHSLGTDGGGGDIDKVTAIGAYSLNLATTGANIATALGYMAGGRVTTAANGVYLGPYSGSRQTTVSNRLFIDDRDRTSAALELTNSLIWGLFDDDPLNQTLQFNAAVTATSLNISGLTATRVIFAGTSGALTDDSNFTYNATTDALTVSGMTLDAGSITDATGAISFGDENLSTGGTLGAGAITGTSLTLSGKQTIGTSPGANGITLDGTDPDYLFQSHAKIASDLATGAYSSIYSSTTITSNQTNNTSIFADWAELYITGDLTLSSANNAAMWGNLEMADAGGNLTLSADTLWLAAVVGTVISPNGLVIGAGRDVAGVLSDSSITAGYTNNGTFSAFAARKSYGKEPWPVAYNVLSGAATIDFRGQNGETIDNATDGTWNFSAANLLTSGNITLTGCAALGLNSAVFQPTTDSTTFFRVLDANGGTPVFNIDSTNERVGFRTATPLYLCDIWDGGVGLVLGGDSLVSTRTNNTVKYGRMGCPHYTNSEEPVGVFLFGSTSDSNTLYLGGGSSLLNTCTHIRMYIAANNTTVTGTEVFRLTPNGYFNFGTATNAETLIEMQGPEAYSTLHNDTHEDTDGGRESRINFKGEQSGGEEKTLARIEVSHDGVADDEKGKIVISTNDGADANTPTEVMRITSAGAIGINTTNPGKALEINHATGGCLRLTYNDSDGSATTKTDMDVDSTGETTILSPAAKTIVFSPVVWDDIYIPLAGAKVPAVNTPTWATFLANLNSYTFAINDYADLATAEILHGYKQGTDIGLHIHIVTNGLNDATARKVKYTIYYSWGDMDEVMSAQGSLTAEKDIPAALADKTHLFVDMGDITGTNYKIGSILKLRVMRIAGTGTEPAVDPFVEMVGVHYQIDTLGSRQELIK